MAVGYTASEHGVVILPVRLEKVRRTRRFSGAFPNRKFLATVGCLKYAALSKNESQRVLGTLLPGHILHLPSIHGT
jgi:hypothetical protein